MPIFVSFAEYMGTKRLGAKLRLGAFREQEVKSQGFRI